MRTAITLGLGLALGLLNTARAQDDDTKADPVPENLLGTYTIVSGEDGGTPVPAQHIEGSKVRITPETIVSTDKDGNELYVAKYRLNTDVRPWKIAMTMTGGPHGDRGTHADGILQAEGETLRLAYAVEGGVVPVTFQTKEGTRQNSFVLKKLSDD